MIDACPISQKVGILSSGSARLMVLVQLFRCRIDHPVRYVIVVIDYDYSTRFEPGQSHLVRAAQGPCTDRYEMHDGFKEDVFTLGNVFDVDFYKVCF